MNKLIAFILCFMFATPAFADGKVASIKEGQKAPYNGYLFDPTAFATIEVDKQELIKKCELDKELLLKKCDGECTFLKDSCKNEKESAEKIFKIQLEAKDKEIDRLLKITLEPRPSRGLWFGIGAGVGVIITTGLVIGIAKAL